MTCTTIPVDLTNPGQVFACIGFAEAANILLGGARGGFDWSDPRTERFHLCASGEGNPVRAVLEFLAHARIESMAPVGSAGEGLRTEKWKVATRPAPPDDESFPIPRPDSPATLPALLFLDDGSGREIRIDHWGDGTRRDNVKFWAGAGGYPGAGLLRDALELARPQLADAVDDPFGVSAAQSSSFRFDWRRDYVPLGIGFSLNEHGKMVPRGYPLTEIMAAVGLTHARPERPDRRDKLVYRYGVLAGDDLPLQALRAGLGCATLPIPSRTFRIQMDWPGQEGQARCITDVVEESSP